MNIFQKQRNFLSLYESCKDEIYTYVYYRCRRNQMLAEDLTSDIFLRAFDRFERYDESHPFRTWIFSIARNRVIDSYRKEKKDLSLEAEESDLSQEEVDFYEVLDREKNIERVLDFLEKLSPKQKLCIEERFLNGWSARHIADHHNMSTDAVEKSITQGLQSLRAITHEIREKLYE